MNKITSHTGFQPLKEVWLGDCYPASYYDHFSNKEKDFFTHITETTKHDLNKFQKKLEELNILVHRPTFGSIENYLDDHDILCKPPITPRDWAITIADTLYIVPQYQNSFTSFEPTIDNYQSQNLNVKVLDRSIPDAMCYVPFPSTVRVGQDLYLDIDRQNPGYEYFITQAEIFSKDYRVHVTHTGDHSDGIFCPVSPGNIFSTHYRKKYNETFPDWQVCFLTDTTKGRIGNWQSGSWWAPGYDYQIYNDTILNRASKWIGNSQETVFEVNMLVIDEKNIFCIAEDDFACRKLESMGFNVHVVDFKTRGFWDGGLHCLTVDIHRTGDKIDYWPNRGENKIYYHNN
jgi:hypothetical protein